MLYQLKKDKKKKETCAGRTKRKKKMERKGGKDVGCSLPSFPQM